MECVESLSTHSASCLWNSCYRLQPTVQVLNEVLNIISFLIIVQKRNYSFQKLHGTRRAENAKLWTTLWLRQIYSLLLYRPSDLINWRFWTFKLYDLNNLVRPLISLPAHYGWASWNALSKIKKEAAQGSM